MAVVSRRARIVSACALLAAGSVSSAQPVRFEADFMYYFCKGEEWGSPSIDVTLPAAEQGHSNLCSGTAFRIYQYRAAGTIQAWFESCGVKFAGTSTGGICIDDSSQEEHREFLIRTFGSGEVVGPEKDFFESFVCVDKGYHIVGNPRILFMTDFGEVVFVGLVS